MLEKIQANHLSYIQVTKDVADSVTYISGGALSAFTIFLGGLHDPSTFFILLILPALIFLLLSFFFSLTAKLQYFMMAKVFHTTEILIIQRQYKVTGITNKEISESVLQEKKLSGDISLNIRDSIRYLKSGLFFAVLAYIMQAILPVISKL
jgi:hypothetical protein